MKQFRSEEKEEAVSSLIEYISITGILLVFIVIILLTVYPVFIENPMYELTSSAYLDIGNGVSTRMVDLYVISPYVQNLEGLVVSDFDIPDDVAGRGYIVTIDPGTGEAGSDEIIISGDILESRVPLAGIGSTLALTGETSSAGSNVICYNSTGGGCPG